MLVHDSADKRLKEQRDAMVVVESDGQVLWIPPAIYMSSCEIDITHFPFDIQNCHMKFGSWTYDGLKLDIHFYEDEAKVDINDYIESNEWNLLGHPAERRVQYYAGLDAPYVDLQFSVILQRVAVFHKYILVLPCVLLSALTLVIFWLPPESAAKMMLGRLRTVSLRLYCILFIAHARNGHISTSCLKSNVTVTITIVFFNPHFL